MKGIGSVLACCLSAFLLAVILACGGGNAKVYAITGSSGPGGTLSPLGTTTVAAGGSLTVTAVPASGYVMDTFTVDGNAIPGATAYAFQDVQADHTVASTFKAIPTFTIAVVAGPNGTIAPMDTQVAAGADQTFTITPAAGFIVANVTVDGLAQGPVASYTFSDVQAPHAIGATFTPAETFALTVSAGPNGTVTPGTTRVAAGGGQAFVITPSPGFAADVVVDGVDLGAVAGYTFSQVETGHSLAATFTPVPTAFTITATAGPNGTVLPNVANPPASGILPVAAGSSVVYSLTPAPGFEIDQFTVDGLPATGNLYEFDNIQANHSLSATFRMATAFKITVTSGLYGAISPAGTAGTVLVATGADQTFTLVPSPTCTVADVVVDGLDIGAVASYTFPKVMASHTISATFALPTGTVMLGNYGIDFHLSSLLDPATQNPVTAIYNPLGSVTTKLLARREIFYTGLTTSYGPTQYLANIQDHFPSSYWTGNIGPDSIWHSVAPPWMNQAPDSTTNNIPVYSNALFQAYPHASAAGDLTGTGQDSVVVVYYTGDLTIEGVPNNTGVGSGKVYLVVINPDGTMTAPLAIADGKAFPFYIQPNHDSGSGNLGHNLASGSHSLSTELAGQVGVTLCDLDGDGKLEVAVLVDSTLVILDDKDNGFAELFECDYRNGVYAGEPYSEWWSCRMAAGDLNGDGKDELVVVQNVMNYSPTNDTRPAPAHYHVYGCPSASLTPVELGTTVIQDAYGQTIGSANVAIGDLLGDGHQEIVFTGCTAYDGNRSFNIQRYNQCAMLLGTWETFNDGTGDGVINLPGIWFTQAVTLGSENPAGTGTCDVWQILPTLCVRPTPGQPKRLVAANRVFTVNSLGFFETNRFPEYPAGNLLVQPGNQQATDADMRNACEDGLQLLAAGDVDQDGQEELVSLEAIARYTVPGRMWIYHMVDPADPTRVQPNVLAPRQYFCLDEVATSSQGDAELVFKSLCLPDWRGEGLTLQFVNRSQVTFSEPLVVAVLAAPPFWAGSSYPPGADPANPVDQRGTTFGPLSVTTPWVQDAIPSASLTVGYAGGDFTTAFNLALSPSGRLSESCTSTQTLTGGDSDDTVVFVTVPYDIYNYNVLCPAASTGFYAIGVPRAAQFVATPLNAFNGIIGNPSVVNADFLLPHTLGVLASYPSAVAGQGIADATGVLAAAGAGYATSSAVLGASKALNLPAVTLPKGVGWVWTGDKPVPASGAQPVTSWDLPLTFTLGSASQATATTAVPTGYAPFRFGVEAYLNHLTSVPAYEVLAVNTWVASH